MAASFAAFGGVQAFWRMPFGKDGAAIAVSFRCVQCVWITERNHAYHL